MVLVLEEEGDGEEPGAKGAEAAPAAKGEGGGSGGSGGSGGAGGAGARATAPVGGTTTEPEADVLDSAVASAPDPT